MIRASFVFATLLCLLSSARANTWGTDMTDIWWNANESGWGMNVAHQGDVVFLTFFVYGADSKAIWYTATATYSGSNSQGAYVFTGPLYQTSGPWIGNVFNPNSVGARQAGTATFVAFVNSATLSYTVDGVQVNKSITRQTFRSNNLTGSYVGATTFALSGCSPSNANGTYTQASNVSVSNTASTFSLTTSDSTGVCTYSGNYVQSGRMGSSNGNYSCNDGTRGTYSIFELEATYQSFSGRISGQNQFCNSFVGRFAAIKL